MALHCFHNNLPPQVRNTIQQAVFEGIGDRPGEWTVYLSAHPLTGFLWQIKVTGQGAYSWERKFETPVEQNAEFIRREIQRCLPK